MLTWLTSLLAPTIVEKLIDEAKDLFGAYLQNKVTREQLANELKKIVLDAFVEVQKAQAESVAKTFDSFMRAASQSRLMQSVWAAVALSQLLVLLWHQAGIPALVFFADVKYPSSGATVDWAYALLMFCLGGGAIALRVGPGKMSISEFK